LGKGFAHPGGLFFNNDHRQGASYAVDDAIRDAKRRQADERYHEDWGDIDGAYVASLNYNIRKASGELVVKRAW
jgi:hypothetical protein